MSETINLDDLAPIEVPVINEGKQYVLREASEDAACKWRNMAAKAAVMVDGKLSAVKDPTDMEPLLVALCLFEVTDKGEKAVLLPTVRGWSHRKVHPLFLKARQISGLEDEQETPEALEKRIAEDQGKLAKLRNGHVEQAEKNS